MARRRRSAPKQAAQTAASLLKAGADSATLAAASARVIGARMPMIAEAMRNPMAADHVELTRMVAEKGSAFGNAAMAAAGVAATMAFDHAAFAASEMARGGRGSPTSLFFRAWGHYARMGQAALEMQAEAMRPIRRAATANARRLKGA
jgi:hypothetical protein